MNIKYSMFHIPDKKKYSDTDGTLSYNYHLSVSRNVTISSGYSSLNTQ